MGQILPCLWTGDYSAKESAKTSLLFVKASIHSILTDKGMVHRPQGMPSPFPHAY
jgi:hypothetical protein